MRGGGRARGDVGRERGQGLSNNRGCRYDKSVDRSKSSELGGVMCFECDSTYHCVVDLKCPMLALKSRAAIQKRAEFSDGNKGALNLGREQLRELKQLRNEKKEHFHMVIIPMRRRWGTEVVWTTRTIQKTKTRRTGLLLRQ